MPVYDDAFITFRYARNLAAAEGFVYNPGEWVLGTTSPLFGLACSFLYWVRLPMPEAAVVLNIILDASVFCLTLVAVPEDRRRPFAFLFAALFAASPVMTRVCVGGMEMNLFLAGSLAVISAYIVGRKRIASLLAALLYFIRPEALVLLAMMVFMELVQEGRKPALRTFGIALATLGIPLVLLQILYGQVLPQSVLAKSEGSGSLPNVVRQLFAPDPLLLALLVPSVAGLMMSLRGERVYRIIALWVVLYVAAYLVGRPKMWSWYGEPVYYGVVFFASLALASWSRRLLLQRARTSWLLGASACIVPIAGWCVLFVTLGSSAVTRNVYDPLDTWCRNHVTPDDTIVASDIGAIGYYSDARIYDLAGLVTPQGHHVSLAELIDDVDPEFLFLNSTKANVEMMGTPVFRSAYRPVARFSKAGSSDLELDPDRFSASWVQDYLMFQRSIPRKGPEGAAPRRLE